MDENIRESGFEDDDELDEEGFDEFLEDEYSYEARENRRQTEMEKAGEAEWTLWTFLKIYDSLNHKSKHTQIAAFEALMEHAERDSKPFTVSPKDVLKPIVWDLFDSGLANGLILYFAEEKSPIADEMLLAILSQPSLRTTDLDQAIRAALAFGKGDLLHQVDLRKLSGKKRSLFSKYLNTMNETE